ncbi:cell division protein FtsQ/DivIB [Phaeovulum vinaykumarii]|uniref:Cell division protein FtsQ n=1 Tax=Phaeovulum vinaykumarii TaxID=407234 RepID=A0A1N7MGH7_9RHOB|nr:cell division protein FtsQ/DivIB [Phaeovulum vinaykumarii]SIS85130.1 Cell division septal protein FtsQ [Phaeovulum vinaykumarii]SOC12095.1 cell division septal protein FtsQ [Phaeovulum vinaykumarii]
MRSLGSARVLTDRLHAAERHDPIMSAPRWREMPRQGAPAQMPPEHFSPPHQRATAEDLHLHAPAFDPQTPEVLPFHAAPDTDFAAGDAGAGPGAWPQPRWLVEAPDAAANLEDAPARASAEAVTRAAAARRRDDNSLARRHPALARAIARRLGLPDPEAQGAAAPAARRDPAPSRLAYRLQRLWLTPVFRSLTRIGVPVFVVVLGLGLWLGDEGRRADLVGRYEALREAIEARPEFRVERMRITGASAPVDGAIRAMLPVALPASSFDIDLADLRAQIVRLDAVSSVDLAIRNGTIEIAVRERVPAILWRHAGGLEMLDATGHRVATLVGRSNRPDLGLIAGQGAQEAVPEALRLLSVAAPILPQLRGLVRVGERRWDMVLTGDRRLLLPAENPVAALRRVLALDKAEDLLARDFVQVDMRLAERPTVRLTEAAQGEYRRIKALEMQVTH